MERIPNMALAMLIGGAIIFIIQGTFEPDIYNFGLKCLMITAGLTVGITGLVWVILSFFHPET